MEVRDQDWLESIAPEELHRTISAAMARFPRLRAVCGTGDSYSNFAFHGPKMGLWPMRKLEFRKRHLRTLSLPDFGQLYTFPPHDGQAREFQIVFGGVVLSALLKAHASSVHLLGLFDMPLSVIPYAFHLLKMPEFPRMPDLYQLRLSCSSISVSEARDLEGLRRSTNSFIDSAVSLKCLEVENPMLDFLRATRDVPHPLPAGSALTELHKFELFNLRVHAAELSMLIGNLRRLKDFAVGRLFLLRGYWADLFVHIRHSAPLLVAFRILGPLWDNFTSRISRTFC